MKKLITCLILSLFVFSLISVASAETVIDDEYNFWTDFMHTLQDLGLFTAAGQSRECSTSADYTLTGVEGSVSRSSLLSGAGCSVALFNMFDMEWHFLDEYRSESIADGFILNSPKIIEVYCCPYPACNSDADCSSSPASDYGDYCNTNYGSCYGEVPSHTTQIIKCINENWVNSGTASFGDDNYCSDSSDNNYIDRNGGEHCRESTYSSVTGTTWCGTTEPDPTCAEEGYSCGYSATASECCSGLECQNFQCVDIENIICGDDICQYPETKTTCPEDCGTLNCSDFSMTDCKTKTNCVYTKTVPFCEDLITSTCDEIYYETGCAKKSTCEWTGLTCKIKGDTPEPDILSTPTTWTEFYSISDDTFISESRQCKTDANCELREGYTVSCLDEDVMLNRQYEITKKACRENSGFIINTISAVSSWLFPGEPLCDTVTGLYNNFKDYFTGSGYCVAESDTWYSQTWDGALKMVGGLGIPVQYVMISLIGMLITLFFGVIQIFK